MASRIVVYDPTVKDEQSKVRGVGRYLQTMYENLPEFSFISDFAKIPKDSVFINPFFSMIQWPLSFHKVAHRQIAVIHDLIPLKYPQHFPIGLKGKFFRILNGFLLKNYDLVVTDSIESKKSIMRYLKIPENHIKVIYPTVPHLFLPHLDQNARDHEPFHKSEGHSVADFSGMSTNTLIEHQDLKNLENYIIYVGDATWNKNLLNFMQAVKMANLTCVCVGKVFKSNENQIQKKPHPWQKMLYTFLNQITNDRRFIIPGYISDTELLALYKKAKVNMLVSYDEGFGLSYIEAAYAGTPSILSDTPIFREVAKDAAVFVNPQDPKNIAQKIAELYYDNMTNETMRIRAFSRAQDFNPSLFRNQWIEVIKKLT